MGVAELVREDLIEERYANEELRASRLSDDELDYSDEELRLKILSMHSWENLKGAI
jgi:hypothetical protein